MISHALVVSQMLDGAPAPVSGERGTTRTRLVAYGTTRIVAEVETDREGSDRDGDGRGAGT